VTEPEIRAWLGVPEDDPRELRDEIVRGMADVPNPPSGPTDEHLAVFKAYLASVGGPPFTLFKGPVLVTDPPGSSHD